MTHQPSFSDMAYDQKKKTRKERFLGEMDEVLPWPVLLAPILEHYPKPGKGRRPIGAEVMLRIYFMQQWYALSDPAMEDSPATWNRCAASRGWIFPACRTRRRSASSAIFWRPTA